MPVVIVVSGVVILLLLITLLKVNAFVSFILVCLFVGLAMGLPVEKIVSSVEKGIGDTLGFLVLILGFGAMLGKIIAQSGAAQKITQSLIRLFGIKNVRWALIAAGFIVGIPLFFTVGFVILIPIVFTIAASAGIPLIYLAVPMLTSLSVTHGFLPPHPSPVAITEMFHADMGKTMLYGIVIAIPVILLAGPGLSPLYRRFRARPLEGFFSKDEEVKSSSPSTFVSILAALMPVILIGLAGFSSFLPDKQGLFYKIIKGTGNPVIAMLISVFFAVFFLDVRRGRKIADTMNDLVSAVSGITMIMLVIAGAGALKEIFVMTGISEYLGKLLIGTAVSPLILGWLIAAAIRIAVGSATVAGVTAAGIVLPVATGTSVSPELMVLSIGAGSLILSHVNDGGFWLVKEYFGLTVRETLCTWSVMETVIAVAGLCGVLILSMFI